MPNINKLIRNTRFPIRDTENLYLLVETATGLQLKLKMVDASINGIAVSYSGDTVEEIQEETVLPASKIVTPNNEEYVLGRCAVRRVSKTGDTNFLALGPLDSRIPVNGVLSKFIEQNIRDRKSPYQFELSPEKFNVGSFEESDYGNIDLFHRAEQFEVYFDEWVKTKKYQHNDVRLPSFGGRVNLKRRRAKNRNDYLVMGSNDYLGLSTHPEVLEAAKKAIDDYGFGSTGSPLTTGLTVIHEELMSLIAKKFNQESALLFNSGYTTNVGTIAGLMKENDFIVADYFSHASLQDGLKMSRAESRLFKHNDMKHLERLLKEHRESHAGSLIVTEGVFSMDGDVPPLQEIITLAKEHNSRVMVDEAHSFGVTGPSGLGCWETCLNEKVDIIMGTFSKICGGIGGFIAADKKITKWLTWHARSHIFSVSIPPSTAAAALAAMNVFLRDPSLHERLKKNIKYFVSGIRNLGCPISADHESAVVPVIIGDENKLGQMNAVFREEGLYVIPVIYPAVSRKNSRFRFTVMATHSSSDLDLALNIIKQAMQKADFRFEPRKE